jgi:hypothetical protein
MQHSPHVKISLLPASLPPRGLSRLQAAEYVGVGPTKFDEMVADGRMPKPKRIDTRTVWDRDKLDLAFAELDDETTAASAEIDRMLHETKTARR